MRSGKVFRAVAAVGLGLLTGCVGFQVDDHSYQFNEATGSLGLRLLLLNAVRASKDYPLQFSKISAYQGSGTTSASVSATLPLKVFPGTGTVAPRVDWKDGISQINLIDLNTEEAQQALKKVLPFRVYTYHAMYGGTRSSIAPYFLMVENLSLSRELANIIGSSVDETCRNVHPGSKLLVASRGKEIEFACKALKSLTDDCPHLYENFADLPGGKIMVKNEVSSACHHKAFMAGVLNLTIIAAVPRANTAPDTSQNPDKPESKGRGPAKQVKKGGDTFNIYTVDPKSDDSKTERETLTFSVYNPIFVKKCLDAHFCTPGKNGGPVTLQGPLADADRQISLQLRTPERLVRYLGELIAAQNYGDKRFVPEAFDAERLEKYTLLTVKRGIPPPGGVAVSIVDPDGETFYVPRQDPDAPKTDLSLELLAIVSDVLNGAVSKKAFPPVTTLTVTTP